MLAFAAGYILAEQNIMQIFCYKELKRKEFKQFIQSKFPSNKYPHVVANLMNAYWQITGVKNPRNSRNKPPRPKKAREPHRSGQPGS